MAGGDETEKAQSAGGGERTLAAYLPPCLRGKHAMCQTGLTLVSLFMRESVSGTGK